MEAFGHDAHVQASAFFRLHVAQTRTAMEWLVTQHGVRLEPDRRIAYA